MKIEAIHPEVLRVTDIPNLDSITIILRDTSPRCGEITIACYEKAWTAFFWALGNHTIRSFVLMADANYLAQKLLSGVSRPTKASSSHLVRIIGVVKSAIEQTSK